MTTQQPLVSQIIQESVNYINYSIKDGLPSAETYDIFQDSKGFIWIGTDNGVVRFDGNKFETFTTQDGLTDNTIFKITEDHLGRIWFGTYNRNLCYLLNEKITPYTYNDTLENKLDTFTLNKPITNLNISREDSVKIEFVFYSNNPIPNMGIDSLGNLSPVKVSNDYSELLHLYRDPDTSKLSVFKKISQLSYFTKQKIGYSRLIQTKNLDRWRVTKGNNLYIFSTSTGIYWYSTVTHTVVRHILSDFFITSFITDNEGGFWCTTLYNGVLFIPNLNIHQFTLGQFHKGKIHSIIPSHKEMLFCFNEEFGNYSMNKKGNKLVKKVTPVSIKSFLKSDLLEGFKLENYVSFLESHIDVSSLIRLSDTSYLGAAPSRGLIIISDQQKWKPNQKMKKEPSADLYGFDWEFTIDGPKRQFARNYEKNQYYVVKLQDTKLPKIIKFFRLSKERILICSMKGLYEINIQNMNITKSSLLGLHNTTRIQDVVQTQDSTLLFATKANGIWGIKNNQKFQIKIETNGKLNSVNQMLYDSISHTVFVATNFGIYQLEKHENIWTYTSIITKYDGINFPDIRQIRIADDQLYFANNNGVGKIYLKNLNPSTVAPYLYINPIFNWVEKHSMKPIQIPFDSNSFEVSFHAIGYKSQNDFVYYYRLNNRSNWRSTTNATISFNSLNPGDYNLQIKAKNVQGIESEIKQVRFNIAAPYWQSWWFISGGLLLCCALLTFIIYRVVLFYKKKTAIQRKLNELQILSLQSKMNPHFIFNSLNSIQNYILTNNKMEANEYLIDFSRLIRTILKNSEKSTILLSKELEILDMYVNLEKKRLRKHFHYSVKVAGGIDLINCEIPTLLIQPYIENAIWHGQVYNNPEGEIIIQISRVNTRLEFEITDNGIGIKKASYFKKTKLPDHESAGTKITKNRIELVSELNHQMSDVFIDEAFPENETIGFVGTRIRFSLPYFVNSN